MSKYKHYRVKLRMAHYISYSLLDSPLYYLDNRSNSRANTCVSTNWWHLLEEANFHELVIHNNFANRMALCRRYVFQVSALSAWDGRVLAYHGFNG